MTTPKPECVTRAEAADAEMTRYHNEARLGDDILFWSLIFWALSCLLG